MHYGGKLKVLNAIGIEKLTFQSLQRIGNIRNAFAHTNITHTIHLHQDGNKEFKTSVTDQLNVMNGAGEIKSKDSYELMVEFLDLYKQIEPELINLRKKLNS